MNILNWNRLNEAERAAALQRPQTGECAAKDVVHDIIEAVRRGGDDALKALSQRLDGCAPVNFLVEPSRLEAAWQSLTPEAQSAMKRAARNIKRFHQAQWPKEVKVEVESGLVCERIIRPIDSVGIYVPGGTAPLFSSLLMAAIPAKLAGVRKVIVTSPPAKNGAIAPVVLAAARLCGLDEVYCVGGAHAIAAMAFGTKTIPCVNKIFGPGNQWVNEAKMQVTQIQGGPAIDLPAGPSEVMVLADQSAKPDWVAADLLSQAEHDPLAQVILLSMSASLVQEVKRSIAQQLTALPRAAIAKKALQSARMIVVENRIQMLKIANLYAPEHLIIQCESPKDMVAEIRNAGSIFVGPYTPEALGDYASGTNHVLPTSGAARAYSGLGLESFLKTISVQSATANALTVLGPVVQDLARMEGLDAHARSVGVRLGSGQ